MSDWMIVGLYALGTALATGLGAIPFVFVRTVSRRTVAYTNAVAAGLMLGACFGLIREGTVYGEWQTIVGAVLGVAFILVTERRLDAVDPGFEQVRGAGAKKMVLIMVVMTVHSIAEGVAVGASFGGGMTLAAVITIAIAVHNVPEGVAITAVLHPEGVSVPRCAGWSVVSSLPQPVLAVPAFLFVEAVRPALPYSIGFAAGAMVFMVFMELLPEAFEEAPRAGIGLLTSATLVLMVLFQRFL
ncbi:MAG: ZIP family metal transporter [Acidobacteriota bacterium]|jgi:zinc transporter ZupT